MVAAAVVRRGFGLVEVTVALTLVAVAALSIAASGAFAQRLLRRAELEEEAVRIGEMLVDSLTAIHAASSGNRDDNRLHIQWESSPSLVLANISSLDSVALFAITFRSDIAPMLDTLPCASC